MGGPNCRASFASAPANPCASGGSACVARAPARQVAENAKAGTLGTKQRGAPCEGEAAHGRVRSWGKPAGSSGASVRLIHRGQSPSVKLEASLGAKPEARLTACADSICTAFMGDHMLPTRPMNRATPTGGVVCATALAVVLLTAVPAQAEWATIPDRRGDVAHGMDIRNVKVQNRPGRLVVTVQHRAIRQRDGAWSAIYIDVDPRQPGPTYLMSGGAGTHWDFFWTSTWKVRGLLGCAKRYRQSFNYRADTSRFVIPRVCLGGATFRASKVRVAAKAGTRAPRVDWAPGRFKLSRWVAEG